MIKYSLYLFKFHFHYAVYCYKLKALLTIALWMAILNKNNNEPNNRVLVYLITVE